MRLERFLQQYPQSAVRPRALMQLGELLVRRADERFAESQRSGNDTTARPDYREAIARYQELLDGVPELRASRRRGVHARDAVLAATATLRRREGLLDGGRATARRSRARRCSGSVTRTSRSRRHSEARRVEPALPARRPAYERAAASAPKDGDIYFLSLYKLGWSYYNQATQTSQAEYSKAVDVFGRLIDAYDKLSPQQQARLGLRSETIEYMAVAFTQVGGAEAANRYFAAHGGADYRLPVMRRVAFNLQEQGDFARAGRRVRGRDHARRRTIPTRSGFSARSSTCTRIACWSPSVHSRRVWTS